MRFANPPYIFDWLVTTLRWLILLGMVVSLAFDQRLSLPHILLCLGTAVWNAILTVLAGFNRRPAAHVQVSLIVDMLVAGLFFVFSGALQGSLGWAGLMPLMTASLYLQWRGALLIALFTVLLQSSLALLNSSIPAVILYAVTLTLLYLGVSLLFTFLSQRITRLVNIAQKSQRAARRAAEQAERERLRVIYHMISTLSASLNYQRVLDTALDLTTSALTNPARSAGPSAAALDDMPLASAYGFANRSTKPGADGKAVNGSPGAGADKLVSAVLLFSKNETGIPELHVGSARRFTATDLRITLPGTAGLIGRCIDNGEPCVSKEIAKDAELSRIVALRNCNSAYCLPLRAGLDTYGVLLFAHPEVDFFLPEYRELLDLAGNQAVIALQNARLYQDLENEKERMMEIQEDARKKMARDLHDGPTQSVAAIAMRVNFARRLIDRDTKATADELFKIEDLARRTTKEIRHMLFTLRPLVLESQGLIAALASMAEKMRETYNQNVIIQADPSVIDALEMGKQAVAFYIAEEAVNNARKHAKANHIWVRLMVIQKDLTLLEVEDDGVGFSVGGVDATYENRGSLGMVNMRERTELINGVLQIDSVEGRGTRILVFIPLTEEASERLRRGL